ncbi:hypothetical protein ACP70R_020155 [Stipagrostis hirtigluma subsp. patula]
MGHASSKELGLEGIPSNLANNFGLTAGFAAHIIVHDNGRYPVNVEVSGASFAITTGWTRFLEGVGAVDGDHVVFSPTSANEAIATVFSTNGLQKKNGSSRHPAKDDRVRGMLISVDDPLISVNTGATSMLLVIARPFFYCFTFPFFPAAAVEDMRRVGYSGWIRMARGVSVEGWMEFYLAEDSNGVKPRAPYYVTRATNVNGALVFPADYTKIAIRPLLRRKDEIVHLKPTDLGDERVRLKIGKDGRAVLSNGWPAFASRSGVRDGAILAFSFNTIEEKIAISIDVLEEGRSA